MILYYCQLSPNIMLPPGELKEKLTWCWQRFALSMCLSSFCCVAHINTLAPLRAEGMKCVIRIVCLLVGLSVL